MSSRQIIPAVLVLACIAGALVWNYARQKNTPAPSSAAPVNSVTFQCADSKSIGAVFYKTSVALTLSDGRSMTLPHAISADGARYSNADESFVFWNKGNTAFVQEGNAQTYQGCMLVAPDPGSLPQTYADADRGFSLRYPSGYTVNTAYDYQEMGPGKDIHGVSFVIGTAMASGTNLSSYDTGVSVEQIPNAQSCDATLFLDSPQNVRTVTDGGTTYSVADMSGAGAGNLYDETIYAIPGTSPCIAVHYMIHSSQIANYPPGTKTPFDKAALVAQFDAIRRTLTLK